MKIELEVELEDEPGALILALEPISSHGGNIHNIFHNREETGKKTLPVKITFDIEGSGKLADLETELRDKKIRVRSIGRLTKRHSTDAILIGHVIDTDLRDTIDRVNNNETTVTQADVKMSDPDKQSSVYIRIESNSIDDHKKAITALKEIAKEKKLLVIEPV